MFRRTLLSAAALGAALSFAALAAHAAEPLKLEVYNPGAKSMFPVSSELVMGQADAVLIDAQFQRNDAEALVQKIKASGKKLTTVYISHSDPDYYFGLDVIQAAFPKAKIVATAPTVAAIKASMDGKLAYWGPVLKDNAPKKLVLPAVLASDRIDGTLWRLGKDGIFRNVTDLDVPCHAHGEAHAIEIRAIDGNGRVTGDINPLTLAANDTVSWLPGRFTVRMR